MRVCSYLRFVQASTFSFLEEHLHTQGGNLLVCVWELVPGITLSRLHHGRQHLLWHVVSTGVSRIS